MVTTVDPRVRKLTVTDMLRLGANATLVVKQGSADVEVDLTEILNALETTSKTEVLAAATTLTAADSGKTFFLNLAGGFQVDLPAVAAGLEFEFIVSTSPTTAYIIVTEGGDDVMVVEISELEVDTTNDGPYDVNADTLNFVANVAVIGDRVRMICDGTKWYARGSTNADGGITTATT